MTDIEPASPDDRRYEECAHTFAKDGSIAGHQGRAAILEFMHSQGLGANPQLQRRHVVTNIAIEISGDVAHVDSDLLVYDNSAASPGGSPRSAATPTGSPGSPMATGYSRSDSSPSSSKPVPRRSAQPRTHPAATTFVDRCETHPGKA